MSPTYETMQAGTARALLSKMGAVERLQGADSRGMSTNNCSNSSCAQDAAGRVPMSGWLHTSKLLGSSGVGCHERQQGSGKSWAQDRLQRCSVMSPAAYGDAHRWALTGLTGWLQLPRLTCRLQPSAHAPILPMSSCTRGG